MVGRARAAGRRPVTARHPSPLSAGSWAAIVGAGAAFLALWTMGGAPAAEALQPRAVDPRVLSEDARPEEAGPEAGRPRIERAPRPEDAFPESAAPPGAADATFVYRALRIEGATALDPATLASAWPHREGETASVADLFDFAAAVTRAYRAAGYVLSQAVVPAQTIEDGIVSIRVVEGHVETVVVRGEMPGGVRDRIRRLATPVVAERPATLSGIEGVLLRARDLPGVAVRGTLSPGEAPGGARLTIDVAYERFGVSVDYSNALPETLDREVVSVAGEARLVGVDLWRVSASTSPGRAYRHVSVLARAAVGEAGTMVGLMGSGTRTRPEGESLLGPVRYRGRSGEVELFASHPLVRGRWETLRTGGGVSMREYRSALAGLDNTDRLWRLSVWGDYELTPGGGAVTGLRGTLSQGLDVWGAGGGSRHAGEPRFTALGVRARHHRPLGGLGGGVVAMMGVGRGQAAFGSGALLSGAECYYGGRRFGAGFDPGALSGDHCAMAALRLQWTRAVQLPGAGTPGRLSLHGLLDAGWVRQKGALEAGERRSASAISASLGARLVLSRGSSIELEAAWPLSHPAGEPDPGARLNMALGYRF